MTVFKFLLCLWKQYEKCSYISFGWFVYKINISIAQVEESDK